MQRSEVIKILGMISAAYPNMKAIDITMVDIWLECLKDIDIETALMVIKKNILESPFPPTIADIRKQNADVNFGRIDSTEAWGEVLKAIRNYGSYREREAIESMSPITGKTVKYMGWKDICMSEKPDVVRGQFLKMYATVEEKHYKDKLLPDDFKNQIDVRRNKVHELTSGLSEKLSLE